jgi:hypothetical protein
LSLQSELLKQVTFAQAPLEQTWLDAQTLLTLFESVKEQEALKVPGELHLYVLHKPITFLSEHEVPPTQASEPHSALEEHAGFTHAALLHK